VLFYGNTWGRKTTLLLSGGNAVNKALIRLCKFRVARYSILVNEAGQGSPISVFLSEVGADLPTT